MHEEILTAEQKKLLPLVGDFGESFGLVVGTAIALHIGHRRSIDFDLFSREKFGNQSLLNKISRFGGPEQIIVKDHFSIQQITEKAKTIFQGYDEKLFRGQLCYFEGVSYAEKVEYLPGFEISDEEIKRALVEFSIN